MPTDKHSEVPEVNIRMFLSQNDFMTQHKVGRVEGVRPAKSLQWYTEQNPTGLATTFHT
jgi:hypothetical protein